MNKFHLRSALDGTTVDHTEMHTYLYNVDFPNVKHAIEQGFSENEVKTLTYTDSFDLRLRQYIAGFRKTLHLVLDDVRMFVKHSPLTGPELIRATITRIKSDFVTKEWYELIPRLESAAGKIERLLQTL